MTAAEIQDQSSGPLTAASAWSALNFDPASCRHHTSWEDSVSDGCPTLSRRPAQDRAASTPDERASGTSKAAAAGAGSACAARR